MMSVVSSGRGQSKDLKLGARIKAERKRFGMSQTAFAALGGSVKTAQFNWEKDISAPHASTLAAWAEAGVDVLYILTGSRTVRTGSRTADRLARLALTIVELVEFADLKEAALDDGVQTR
jgi:transcriptional regulator with XRE-family HTH domain